MPEQHAAGPELKTGHRARIHRDQKVKGDLLDQLAGIELDGKARFPIDRPQRLPERREAVPRDRLGAGLDENGKSCMLQRLV